MGDLDDGLSKRLNDESTCGVSQFTISEHFGASSRCQCSEIRELATRRVVSVFTLRASEGCEANLASLPVLASPVPWQAVSPRGILLSVWPSPLPLGARSGNGYLAGPEGAVER